VFSIVSFLSKLFGDKRPMAEWRRCGLYQPSIHSNKAIFASAFDFKRRCFSSSFSSVANTKQRYTTEEIIHKLREADVLIGQGHTVAQATKQIGVTDKTYFRWRKTHGGLRIDQAKRLRDLEAENARLKKAVPELTVICPEFSGPGGCSLEWNVGDL
jgi:putative transposase